MPTGNDTTGVDVHESGSMCA